MPDVAAGRRSKAAEGGEKTPRQPAATAHLQETNTQRSEAAHSARFHLNDYILCRLVSLLLTAVVSQDNIYKPDVDNNPNLQ